MVDQKKENRDLLQKLSKKIDEFILNNSEVSNARVLELAKVSKKDNENTKLLKYEKEIKEKDEAYVILKNDLRKYEDSMQDLYRQNEKNEEIIKKLRDVITKLEIDNSTLLDAENITKTKEELINMKSL